MRICDYCHNIVGITEELSCECCGDDFDSCCEQRFCTSCRKQIVVECSCGLFYDQEEIDFIRGWCECGNKLAARAA